MLPAATVVMPAAMVVRSVSVGALGTLPRCVEKAMSPAVLAVVVDEMLPPALMRMMSMLLNEGVEVERVR